MQTTHKIPGSSATRYAEYLTSTSNRADYYTSDGKLDPNLEVPSQWHGSAKVLKDLGLSADESVGTRDLVITMNGFNPRTKEALRPVGSNGERVAGIELMMAPPKTVSAQWATAKPERREQIEAAHRKAVSSALKRTEREVALVRRKTGRVTLFEKAKSLFAAELIHTSSRLAKDQERGGIPDPQLHSHVVVMAAERQDGKLAAVESRQLYRSARENGAWYRAELAANLQELGLQIDRRTGNGERYFELSGVPEDLASYWSKRAEDIHHAANLFRQRYGREPRAGELGSLTVKTRGSKSAASHLDINRAWRAFGSERGLSTEQNERLFNDRNIEQHTTVDVRKDLLKEVTREHAMIDTHELKAKAYELSAGVCRPAEADQLIEELHRSGELLRLEGNMWTTRYMRELEQETVQIAERRANEITAPVSEQSLKQARREIGRQLGGSLTQEQRDALATITGPAGVTQLTGWAGTGKGVVLTTAARAWKLDGYKVIGTAIAGSTAQRLRDTAKLDKAYTADKLINAVQKGTIQIGPDTIVIMDEAGMSDNERKAQLVKLTDRFHSKFLSAGDAAQLQSIGAGGLYKEMEGRAPTAELTEVHRANHEWERNAWAQIRAGEPGPAIAAYQSHDRLHLYDTRPQAAEAMVDHWDLMRKELPDGQAVMITDASNLERDQINAMAQERRAQAGELGAHRIELPGKPYGLRAGDQVIFSAQFYPPGQERIENGISGTIVDTSRDEDQSTVTIRTEENEPREIDVDTNEFSELSLRYAVHIIKGQGITAETSGVLIGGWQTDKEHAYVDVSRAREETQIYTAREDLGEMGFDIGAMERLADRMQRSRAQEASITRAVVPYEPEISPEMEPQAKDTPEREPAVDEIPLRERTIDEVVAESIERQVERDREAEVERDELDRGFGVE
jgi:conjugative relaxase-like TrwC/TraI family protein